MSNMNQTAFPMTLPDLMDAGNYVADGMAGLTKLEYAAIQIMTAMYANPAKVGTCSELATASVKVARALFAELEKSE